MNRPTPAPWFAYRYDGADGLPSWRIGNENTGGPLPLAEVYDGKGLSPGHCGNFYEAKANAELIAAAPDLLAALIEARQNFVPNNPTNICVKMMEAAIKKAQGL